jgi:manganese/iron transport system ATP-binding protein
VLYVDSLTEADGPVPTYIDLLRVTSETVARKLIVHRQLMLSPNHTAPTAPGDIGSGISVRDITVTYRNGHTALREASFDIPTGTITALVGVNGRRQVDAVQGDHGLPADRPAGEISMLGLSGPEALRENLVAYVPQSEEVDWSFPCWSRTW